MAMSHLRSLRRTFLALVAVTVVVLWTCPALAQQATSPVAPLAATGADAAARERAALMMNADTHVKDEYHLGPGDLLSVRIVGVDKYDRLRVSNSGKIHVPYVGILKVYGMTPGEVERSVAQALRDKGLINDPSVQVDVTEQQSKPVYILGEVIIPGQFVIVNEMHVLELVALGGGFNEFAIPVAYLYRRTPVESDPTGAASGNSTRWSDEVIKIDFDAIAAGRAPDLKLQAGDVLYVPERKKLSFYVAGDVAQPGAFSYPQMGSHKMTMVSSMAVSDRPLRVSEAVARAGGPLRTAKKGQCVLVRFDKTGASRQFPFNLTNVLQGREQDMVVLPNDIIFVPGSTVKSLGYGMVKIIPSVLLTGLVF